METLQSETRKMTSSINEMDAGLSTLNEELSELQNKLMEKEKQIHELHMKTIIPGIVQPTRESKILGDTGARESERRRGRRGHRYKGSVIRILENDAWF